MPFDLPILSAALPRVVYIGNGTRGPFVFADSGTPIRVRDSSDLVVRRYASVTDEDGTLLTLDTDYTVSNTDVDDVEFTLTSAQDVLTSSQRIVATREQAIPGVVDLTLGGDFSGPALADAIGILSEQVQELRRDADRSVKADWRATIIPKLPLPPSSGMSLLARVSTGALAYASLADLGDPTLVESDWLTLLGIPPWWKIVTVYGATADGSTEDTAAFQLALAAAGVGGVVYAPAPGTYIVDDIDVSLANQTIIVERGAVLKQKANTTNHTLIDVAAAGFKFYGSTNGNKSNGNADAGYINLQIGASNAEIYLHDATQCGYFPVFGTDCSNAKIRIGKVSVCDRAAFFLQLDNASAHVKGPDIEVDEIDFSDRDPTAFYGGGLIRGLEISVDPAGWRFVNGRIRIGKIIMPDGATLTSMVGLEIKACTGFDVRVEDSYGGSMALSMAECDDITYWVNGRGYTWYGFEPGGLLKNVHGGGNLNGRNAAGTIVAKNAIAAQGSAGLNENFSFVGNCDGAISQVGQTGHLINVANLSKFYFGGTFSCGAAEHVFRFTDNGPGVCNGHYFGDTGGDRVAIFAESAGKVTITGKAKQFDLAVAHITSNATAVDNIKIDVDVDDCNGGGITSVITGSGTTGDHIASYGKGQLLSAGNVRGNVINYSRNVIDCELTGSPEGVVTAGPGSIARRVDGTDGTTLLVKSTGTGNTGWDALPYYEEGTFTPSITFVTPGNLALTSVTAAGKYTRRGNRVEIEFAWTGTPTFTTSAGGLRLTGLPFTAGAAQIAAFKLVNISSAFAWPAARTMVQPYALSSTTTMALGALGTGAALADFTTANLTSAAAHTIEFSGSYRV